MQKKMVLEMALPVCRRVLLLGKIGVRFVQVSLVGLLLVPAAFGGTAPIGTAPIGTAPIGASPGESTLALSSVVDLNTASAKALAGLPGIGAVRAEEIIARREQVPFQRKEELLALRGIGPTVFAGLEALIVVDAAR